MAEGDGAIYRNFKQQVMEGIFDLGSDTIKVALVSGYTPNIVTHQDWADASAQEVTGTGYTAGGKTLAGATVTQTGTGGTAKGVFDGTNVTWTGLNIGGTSGSPSHAIMWDDTPGATPGPADPLIAYWEVTTATNGGNYTLSWNTAGIITLT